MARLIFKMLHVLLVLAAIYTIYKYIVSIDVNHMFSMLTKTKDTQGLHSFFAPNAANSTNPGPITTTLTAMTVITVEVTSSPSHPDRREIVTSNTRKSTISITGHGSKDFMLVGYKVQTFRRSIKKVEWGVQMEEGKHEGEDEGERTKRVRATTRAL